MLFNTVKLLSPTGDGAGQDQTPAGQGNDNKQPTLEEVVKGFSTVNETVSKITQTLENVMKAVEELKAPKKADNIEEIAKWPEVKKMPCYPDDGSIAVCRGVVVVKFADE